MGPSTMSIRTKQSRSPSSVQAVHDTVGLSTREGQQPACMRKTGRQQRESDEKQVRGRKSQQHLLCTDASLPSLSSLPPSLPSLPSSPSSSSRRVTLRRRPQARRRHRRPSIDAGNAYQQPALLGQLPAGARRYGPAAKKLLVRKAVSFETCLPPPTTRAFLPQLSSSAPSFARKRKAITRRSTAPPTMLTAPSETPRLPPIKPRSAPVLGSTCYDRQQRLRLRSNVSGASIESDSSSDEGEDAKESPMQDDTQVALSAANFGFLPMLAGPSSGPALTAKLEEMAAARLSRESKIRAESAIWGEEVLAALQVQVKSWMDTLSSMERGEYQAAARRYKSRQYKRRSRLSAQKLCVLNTQLQDENQALQEEMSRLQTKCVSLEDDLARVKRHHNVVVAKYKSLYVWAEQCSVPAQSQLIAVGTGLLRTESRAEATHRKKKEKEKKEGEEEESALCDMKRVYTHARHDVMHGVS